MLGFYVGLLSAPALLDLIHDLLEVWDAPDRHPKLKMAGPDGVAGVLVGQTVPQVLDDLLQLLTGQIHGFDVSARRGQRWLPGWW